MTLRALLLICLCAVLPVNAESVKLIFVGDIMLDDGPGKAIAAGRDPLAPFAALLADIRAARAAGADLVIPFMHWGWENNPKPDARQRQLARLMIDVGADVVVGSHPHVTQGSEIYRGKPIIYSLGNFVFDGFDLPAGKLGWLLRMNVDRSGVLSWETRAALMDEEGIPRPVPGAQTPCGKAGDSVPGLCVNP